MFLCNRGKDMKLGACVMFASLVCMAGLLPLVRGRVGRAILDVQEPTAVVDSWQNCNGPQSEKVFIPLAYAGLNNIKAFLYDAVQLAKKSGRTMLLPIVRERPHLMGTPRYQSSDGMISLSEVYEADHFCKTVERMGVCIRC